ncbi:hypothetical protein BBD46_19355 [Natrialba sp. SSL1]|nr:hypothetical protein BBD46_19355 [Natrialba sp. SSL1]
MLPELENDATSTSLWVALEILDRNPAFPRVVVRPVWEFIDRLIELWCLWMATKIERFNDLITIFTHRSFRWFPVANNYFNRFIKVVTTDLVTFARHLGFEIVDNRLGFFFDCPRLFVDTILIVDGVLRGFILSIIESSRQSIS